MKSTIIFLSILTTVMLTSCGTESDSHDDAHAEESHDEQTEANTTMLTEEQMKSIKIELGFIEKKQLTSSLKANGILKVPNQNKASATAALGGVVNSILVQSGNFVNKGQIIATISNTTFIGMQEEYITISAKTDYAKLEYTRQSALQVGNASSLKALQAAEAELIALRARKASLEKQLELIGINPDKLTAENMQSAINITSPITGTVSNVLVNIGSYADANNTIIEIVDNSQLHVDIYVYEKDLSKLKVGQTIHFTLTNNPGGEYDAIVYGISNTFEENTKAIAVHAKVEGDKTGLIDGMSITAVVSLDNATLDAVPTNAIINHEGQDYIFIVTNSQGEGDHDVHDKTDSDHKDDEHGHEHNESATSETGEFVTFEKIPVRKGTTDIGYSEITLLKDIPDNSKVVVNGAFFILAKMTNQGEAHEH